MIIPGALNTLPQYFQAQADNWEDQDKTMPNEGLAGRFPSLPRRAARLASDQTVCRYFQSPLYIGRLSDSQTATLDLAFSEGNIGGNITIMALDNTSEKLRLTAEWINARLDNDCPTGLQIDLFRLVSAAGDETIYRSQSKSLKATVALPVKPEALSYIDSGEISCLHIDVLTASGQTARVDILNVTHALEQEYASRVRNKFFAGMQDPCYSLASGENRGVFTRFLHAEIFSFAWCKTPLTAK